MTIRSTAITLVSLVALASCSSAAVSRHATSAPPSSAVPATTTTTAPGATMNWRVDTRLGPSGATQCNALQQCVVPGTESGTLDGDLRGTSLTGNSTTFDKSGSQIAGSRIDLFRGAVKGCGSGTLVFFGTETIQINAHRGRGDWRIVPGFGTGDLAHVTGHGTAVGNVDATGFHSEWHGVIDCGR